MQDIPVSDGRGSPPLQKPSGPQNLQGRTTRIDLFRQSCRTCLHLVTQSSKGLLRLRDKTWNTDYMYILLIETLEPNKKSTHFEMCILYNQSYHAKHKMA